jgi:ubiquinone/menaquinone biosynthesis C-methylase UbiE
MCSSFAPGRRQSQWLSHAGGRRMTEARVDADAFNAFEEAGWEKQAAGYEDFFGRITTRLVEPLLDAAGVGPGDRVLDVASGPGYVAAKADERGASAIGVDVAEAMVSLARRLHPQLEFRRGNAEALPFPDESFDAVLGNFLMLHLGRPEQAVAEFFRVLAPGGRLALTVWDVPERARFLGVLLDSAAAAGASAPKEIPVGPPIFRFSDEQEFARLLGSHGLEAIQVRTISFSHPAASPDELWRGLLGGTVRTSALILSQTADMQREIRAAFDRIVQEYQVGDRLEVPVSVKLASGRKPAALRS